MIKWKPRHQWKQLTLLNLYFACLPSWIYACVAPAQLQSERKNLRCKVNPQVYKKHRALLLLLIFLFSNYSSHSLVYIYICIPSRLYISVKHFRLYILKSLVNTNLVFYYKSLPGEKSTSKMLRLVIGVMGERYILTTLFINLILM